MRKVLSFCFLGVVIIGSMISCNKSMTPTAPSNSDTFNAKTKSVPTPTFTSTPNDETTICVLSGDPGTTGTIITNATALANLGRGDGGKWFGDDASGDCTTVQPDSYFPNITISSTATLNIPIGDTILDGTVDVFGGCNYNVSVNGHSFVGPSNGSGFYADVKNFLVAGNNTVSIAMNNGTCFNTDVTPIPVCFGINYEICATLLQPTAVPSQTPTPTSPTPTNTPTGTQTPPTSTPTGTLTPPTNTPTSTPTDTPTFTETTSETTTQSATTTDTVTDTPTITPTPTLAFSIVITPVSTAVAPSGPSVGLPNTTTNIFVQVVDQFGTPHPTEQVTAVVTPVEFSGGHQHDTTRPGGTVSLVSPGVYQYASTVVSGQENIEFILGSDPSVTNTLQMNILVPGLTAYSGIGTVLGQTASHPNNDFLAPGIENEIDAVITSYELQSNSGGTITLNDMSLEMGGIFDINDNWSTPHKLHRIGHSCDVNHIDTQGAKVNRSLLKTITSENGGNLLNEPGGELHMEFN